MSLTKFNFGLASARDTIVYGAQRAGHEHPELDTPRTPRGPPTASSAVVAWAECVKAKGVKRVLCLLSAQELTFYETPLQELYAASFAASGVTCVAAMYDQGALAAILDALSAAERAREPIVVHCASGQRRTADVLALWLHNRYHISVEEAVAEVAAHSKTTRTLRKPSVRGVLRLMSPSIDAMPPGPPRGLGAAGGGAAAATARKPMHVGLVQLGGTIDLQFKDGALARGRPAMERVLQRVAPLGFSFSTVHIAQLALGSRPRTGEMRSRLTKACNELDASKLLITADVDSLLELAAIIRGARELAEKAVVLTGSLKPESFSDSDASFNIGVAFGALNVLRRGVFVCMTGRGFEGGRCSRDAATGEFLAAAAEGKGGEKGGKPPAPPGGGGGGGGGKQKRGSTKKAST